MAKLKEDYELSIVIPCYNEVKSIPELFSKYKEAKKGVKFQLVLVDNGSSDGTWKYLTDLRKKNKFLKIVRVVKNIGYGNGIHKGLSQCDGNVIGWSHGDLQCSPKDIFKGYDFYKKFENPRTLVKGHRKGRDPKSFVLTYGLALIASAVLLKSFDDINGQPKIFPKALYKKFENPPHGFSYDLYVQYLAKKNGYKVRSFPVRFEKRIHGFSKWANSIYSKFSTIKIQMVDIFRMRFNRLN